MEMAFRVYTAAQALGHSRMRVLGYARKMLRVFNACTVVKTAVNAARTLGQPGKSTQRSGRI